MPTLARLQVAMLLLTLLLLSGCASARDHKSEGPLEGNSVDASSAKPDLDTRIVMENWPNGSRKFRKTVIESPDGTVLDHGTYTKWHTNGQKEYEATYIHGKLQGAETSWHKNGQRRAEAHYDHGLRHGTLRSWDPHGRLRKEETYFNDKPHGTWTVWTAEGKIKWQAEFEHGVALP
jgi:antitoxin component YwqK of YwqJK toxin-antitoxin module